ncbi:CD248 molecule, endosialin a [Pungitius pungitius]|uniref:CD248 molecule, endosialin a n=1 Tax=Pungitius pungitius TaxID=134920 RepID=UPI002E0F5310
MSCLVSSAAALLLTSLLASFFGCSWVLGQDLKEDALCYADGCFVVYFQRKTFLDSWRACKEKGGNLATIKRREDAAAIATLLSNLDLRQSNSGVRVWIGLQRQPRQCTTTRPLRGFSWTTGDQDTEYTNWQKEDSPSMCSVSRCVVMSYSTKEQSNNFKWLDGSCTVPVDGYLCRHTYKGMCPALRSEGAGNTLYTTPFKLLSTLLTHLPYGSSATIPCPAGTKEEQSVSCVLKEDGLVGWSRDSPLCSDPPVSHDWCNQDNGGCEHFCRSVGAHVYCYCAEGYELGDNGQNCELPDVCQGAPCEFMCLPLSDGYQCACPEGYMLAPDERACQDIDECLHSPCEQLCVNAPGTFECQCWEGYHLDNEGGCEDIDECVMDPCEHACENTQGSHICHCHLGYSPVPEEPSRCQDIDECQIPGTCEKMCVNYEGGFDCYCEEGYELMSDQYSCGKRGEGDQSAVTPPFAWVTPEPRPVWNHMNYDWNKRPTDWSTEGEQSLNWLTDPPRALGSDIIWVTSAPQEELLSDLPLGAEEDEEQKVIGGDDSLGQRSEPKVFPTTIYTTPTATTSSVTTPDWSEDNENDEETTTALPFLSTSTISEGAWATLTTSNKKPTKPEDSFVDHNMPTKSSYPTEAEKEHNPPSEKVQFPEEKLGGEVNEFVDVTHQDPAVPTQNTPSPSDDGENVDLLDSVQEDKEQKQSNTWLLVGILVPICFLIVLMVVIGIVYCTRCAVHSRNKNATDCYHWISGAHDKQGAPNPSAGVNTHV